MELALEAIRGHKSAHSLATGPVMAEPGKTRVETLLLREFVKIRYKHTIHTVLPRIAGMPTFFQPNSSNAILHYFMVRFKTF
jgi:hypothetical protein